MKLKGLIKKISFVILLFFLGVITFISVSALEKEEVSLRMCTLNESYLEWEKLSDLEKAKVMAPPMCKTSADQVNVNDVSKSLFKAGVDTLPEVYDSTKKGYNISVKDQVGTNSCWAFSSISSLEYYAKKELSLGLKLSPRHLVYSSVRNFLNGEVNDFGYNNHQSYGGNFFMSSNYFVNTLGPVLESDMPFENNQNDIEIAKIKNKTVQLDVNDIILNYDDNINSKCSTNEIKEIKEYVYNYGSVAISTHMTENPVYYNNKTGAFFYNGADETNHAVLIVGWDDNYSKDNFSSYNRPMNNGAWIVQNSYGTSFGDNGYYYISYEDVHVCNFYMVIKSADQEFEDNAYIYDKLGFNAFYGLSSQDEAKTDAYAMNVFTKNSGSIEVLKELTFASSGVGEYKIYYAKGKGQELKISDMKLIGSGNLDAIGYVTHKLENPVLIDSEVTDFSIAVYYDMDTSTVPLPLSSGYTEFYRYMAIGDNKSFVSADGNEWYDLKTMSSYPLVASIKAFTDNYQYTVDKENELIFVQPNTLKDTFISNANLLGITSDDMEDVDKVYTGLKYGSYTIIVLGDVNGDGLVRMNDVMTIAEYIVDGTGIEEQYYKKAADVTLDSNIRMNDVMTIATYIVEGGTL